MANDSAINRLIQFPKSRITEHLNLQSMVLSYLVFTKSTIPCNQSLNYQKITVVLSSCFAIQYTQTSPYRARGILPGFLFAPKEKPWCPTSPSVRAAIRVVPDSPKVGTVRSMRKRLREPTSATNDIRAPTSVTAHPGGKRGRNFLTSIPSASCAEGREERHRLHWSTTSMPPDRAVPMTRRTSWPCAQAAIPPSTDDRKMMGCTRNFS